MRQVFLAYLLLIPAAGAAPANSHALPEVVLTESKVLELARAEVPRRQRIRSQRENERNRFHLEDSNYSWSLAAAGSYSETNEQGITAFVPVFSPRKTGQLYVQRRFAHGIEARTGIETSQMSSVGVGVNIATTSRLFAQADISLWKNMLGKLSRARLANAQLQDARSEITREIELHNLRLDTRRLYWALVANERALRVTRELQETAERQLKDARRRLRNSVSDKAEVSRYQAQVATRKSQILLLRAQRESLAQQLRQALPQLTGKALKIPAVDSAQTRAKVLQCVEIITQDKTPNLSHSRYDEIIGILQAQSQASLVANDSIDDPDLLLSTKVMTTGVGGSYGKSFNDFDQNNRAGFAIGLNLSIPLSGEKWRARESANARDQARFAAEEAELKAALGATYQSVLQNVDILIQAIESQRESTSALRTRLKEMRKKFKQARISVTELVNDQDALLSAELSVIDTQLAILNTLFDYFSVFTETPCAFNQRGGA